MYTWLKDTLPNGMRVVTIEVPHLHSVMASVYVLAGSRHDPPHLNGISHFLEHVLFRGCETYPSSRVLNTRVEEAGGCLNGVTTRDFGYYYTLIHPEGLKVAFEVLGQMIASPLMQELEIERAVILEEILDEVDENGHLIDIDTISKQIAFDGHPLSLPIAGNARTVSAIEANDLRTHHARCYGASNLVLSVAGPVRHKSVLELANEAFGQLPRGSKPRSEPPPPLPTGPLLKCVSHSESQSTVRLTFPAVPENHPDYLAQILLVRILDDGIASRLQQEIVEKRGLAYAVSAGLDVMADTALLEVEATVAHPKVPELLAALQGTLADLTGAPASCEELARAVARHRYDIDFMHDSVADLAGWFGIGELHETALPLEKRISDAKSIGAGEVHEIASRLLCSKRMLAVVVGRANESETRRVIETEW